MKGQAGGSPRAAFTALPPMPLKMTTFINFDIVIPEDWCVDDDYVLIHDIHTRHAPSGGMVPMALYVVGDQLKAVFKTTPDTKVAANYWMHWVPGEIYEFRSVVHVDTDFSGYYRCDVNGQEWFHYTGATSFLGEKPEKGPIWKVGPYHRFGKADYRRMLVRV